jgi:mono/diheme cytochrome c family protein/glucose/arabinose dehydrogenase
LLGNLPAVQMNRPFLLTACALAAGATVWALHPQNAGPAQFEIKFKLPAPKPLSPGEALKAFKIQPGYKVELFAAEPLVECPIAMSWDEQGRMFVVEMRGYMHNVEGTGEDQPNGVIAVLEDTNGDGKADKRTVFAEGLVLPRAVCAINGGALVAEPPTLWFMKDTNGDGKADVKEAVDGAYGSRTGQPEHMANSPTRFLDNWVYSANHGTRYRLKDGKWLSESVQSRGQWGMCQDNYGRPYYNFNSDFLRANFVPELLYKRNPNWTAASGTGVQVVKEQATWPIAPTPGVNRGYDAGSLTSDGKLKASTATCGAIIDRSGVSQFGGDAFIPEPAGNLVKRFTLTESNGAVSGKNTLKGEEFLASTDERFRPVTAYTGPDGALYLADMYRGIIQHKGFLTHYLIANIKDRNLEQPVNRGRIWRIVPDGAKLTAPKLPTDAKSLVGLLGHANGWVRDTAQRLLVEKQDTTVTAAIAEVVKTGAPLAKIHALWTLEGLAALTPDVTTVALKDGDAKVRAAAVRLADRTLVPELAKLVSDPSIDVQIALGFALSGFPEAQDATLTLARNASADAMVRDAIVSGLRGRELEALEALIGGKSAPAGTLGALAASVMNERRAARVEKLLKLISAQPANGPVQLALLEGASGKNAAKGGPKPKLLYLTAEVPELAKLTEGADAKAKPLLAALDGRIAWPNKPGVPPPPVVKPLTAAEQQLFETGKQVYTTLCAACHQPNGQGMDGLAPSLIDSDWVLGREDMLPRIVIHGLTGPINVNGQTWSLEMPPLGAALSDEQVAGVTTYIRREWEHTASPVSVEQVKRLRSDHKDRTKPWTAAELGMGSKKQAKK